METTLRPSHASGVACAAARASVGPFDAARSNGRANADGRATTAPGAATCQKCGGRLCLYDRNGVVVEQCEDCRGIFLDQGELERLIEAEGGGWSGVIRAPSTLTTPAVSTGRAPCVTSYTAPLGEPISARPPGLARAAVAATSVTAAPRASSSRSR